MREYSTREEVEQDPELNLMIIWKCDKCGTEREEYPHCNEGGCCSCGGVFFKSGETYNAL